MTEGEGFWGGVCFNLNTHAQKEGEKNTSASGGGEAPVRVKYGGGATHVLRRGGGDRRDTGRQRKQRAEKCGFYLTAFVILPRHAMAMFACVRERKRERERERERERDKKQEVWSDSRSPRKGREGRDRKDG